MNRSRLIFVFFTLALVGSACLAQLSAERRPASAVSIEAGLMQARVAASDVHRSVLTIAGPEAFLETRFEGSAGGALALRRADGTALADGSYTWELRTIFGPSEAREDQLQAHVESGTFRVTAGVAAMSLARRGRVAEQRRDGDLQVVASADVVQADDVVVQGDGAATEGGLCVGYDCVDGETFPTASVATTDDESWILMDGQQTGIRFNDTGGSGGSPASNDWQILANTPDASGAEQLTIEDVSGAAIGLNLQAGLSDNSLFVAPQNSTPATVGGARIGIGTTTPQDDVNVTVQGGTQDASILLRNTTNEWLLAGGANGFAVIDSTDTLLFEVQPNAAQDSLSVGPVDGAGRAQVGIGTRTPQAGIHIAGLATQDLFSGMGPDLIAGPAMNYGYSGTTFGRSSGFFNVRPDASAIAPNPSLRFMTRNQQRLIIDNQGFLGLYAGSGGLGVGFDPAHPIQARSGAHLTSGGIWTNSSSREFKFNVHSLSPLVAMVALQDLDPVRYRYHASPDEEHLGFIAEDVPEVVASGDRTGMSPMDVVAVLTRVVQVQQGRLTDQSETIQSLEERLAKLEALLASQGDAE